MLSRWEIQLAGPANTAIPLTAPQAVVSRWLDDPPARRANGTARLSGHADQARKWAWGPPRTLAPAGPASTATRLALQIRIFDERLERRLNQAIQPGTHLRLGTAEFEILSSPELVERASWQSLRHWPGTRAWQIRFLTPTCFRRGNRTSPWPAPETLIRGLTDRWRRLHPQTSPEQPAPGPSPIWVSDIDGHSEAHTLTRNIRKQGTWHREDETISGFTGRLRYVCDTGTNDQAATFHALMNFAAYAGVGSHTTYGLGIIEPEPTWQPPTAQGVPVNRRPVTTTKRPMTTTTGTGS
jgi:CRISPR-associated endoribonuclease Cas6